MVEPQPWWAAGAAIPVLFAMNPMLGAAAAIGFGIAVAATSEAQDAESDIRVRHEADNIFTLRTANIETEGDVDVQIGGGRIIKSGDVRLNQDIVSSISVNQDSTQSQQGLPVWVLIVLLVSVIISGLILMFL